MPKLPIFLAALGGILILVAVILGQVVFPNMIENSIKAELRLVRGSSTWNKWVEIETPVYLKFYIFNVTNPDEVVGGTALPILEEVGPYVYRQRRSKVDPVMENCKETVKYEQSVTYFFDEEKSGNNTQEDVVNIVNVPFISVMKAVVANFPPEFVPVVARILSSETIIRSRVSVGELTFEGFDVSNYNNSLIADYLPAEFSDFKFGLYKTRNSSTDGMYEVFTGVKNVERFGSISTWNGNSELPYWNSTKCNQLGGTDGSLFRPFLDKNSAIHIFNSEICRQLELAIKEEIKVKDIKGYRFSPGKEELAGAANNPENSCYCLRENKTECQDGIIDFGVCRSGAPIVLSTPHFLDGYEGYVSGVVGLVPNRTLHETTIDIEPRSGLLLEAHKRIQINLEVRRVEDVPQLEVLNDTLLFPVLWMDEEALICDVDAEDFNSRVQQPIKTVNIVKWTAIGVGAALVIIGFAIPFARRNRKSMRVA